MRVIFCKYFFVFNSIKNEIGGDEDASGFQEGGNLAEKYGAIGEAVCTIK